MRNSGHFGFRGLAASAGLCAMALALAGCADNSRDAQRQQQDTLNVGYAALEQRQFDRAMGAADQYLTRTPTGPGSAEAHYLRGRILEDRPAASQQESAANWQQAKSAYEQALAAQPTPAVEWRARAGLGNVAYFQEDYGTALAELGAAYDKINERAVQRSAEMGAGPEVKAWILYRMGLCQQRLGRMEEADRSFAAVQEQFGGTVPAQRAREHQGQHQFWVQVATFAENDIAERAADELKREGKNVVKLKDTAGHFVVRVGPLPTYQAAKNIKTIYAARYQAAVIVP